MTNVGEGDIVLDFFAGSGSTAHAVALQNAEDGARRRAISVNIPEKTTEGSAAREAGFETVSAITRARLSAVARQELTETCGLRAYSLSTSNFRTPTSSDDLDLSESTLALAQPDWQAIAAEVLLKEGVALDEPWVRHEMAEAQVVVAGGVAVALSKHVDNALVVSAFELGARVVVFLEDGFAGADAVKANAFTNAKNAGIVMKTI